MMTGRIKVRKYPTAGVWVWRCDGHRFMPVKDRAQPSQQEALNAGLEHLYRYHRRERCWPRRESDLVPNVSVQSSTRCTCGDLPATSYPYFRPCPVHTYLVNTSQTMTGATLLDERGDRAPGDPGASSGPQNGAYAIGEER